jgi:molecular chaperone DnaJ
MSDPYDVLGVERDCDLSSIKKAYRKLSLQYHPDRNNSNEANEKMLKINAAYEIIGEAHKVSVFIRTSKVDFHKISKVLLISMVKTKNL